MCCIGNLTPGVGEQAIGSHQQAKTTLDKLGIKVSRSLTRRATTIACDHRRRPNSEAMLAFSAGMRPMVWGGSRCRLRRKSFATAIAPELAPVAAS